MRKYMRESAAWRLIARAFHTHPKNRSRLEDDLAFTGLCNAALHLRCPLEYITKLRHRLMQDRLNTYARVYDHTTVGYWWPVFTSKREYDFKRRDVALLFALRAAREEAKQRRKKRKPVTGLRRKKTKQTE